MRLRRRLALSLAVALLAMTGSVAVLNGGSAAGATAACPTSFLDVGQRLIADTRCWQLRSAGGRFALSVLDDRLWMEQYVRGAGSPTGQFDIITGGTWSQSGYHDASRRNMTLLLKRTGNLVLEGPLGVVFWQTGTGGSGATHLVLRDNGRLVLLTATGKRVWASNSGIYALGGSDRVLPGGFLMNSEYGWSFTSWGNGTSQWDYRHIVSVSRMLTTGDFVAYCPNSTRVFWHTNTHTPGSFLTLLESGRLVVEAPSGRILWSTPTNGWRDAFSTMGTQVSAGTTQFWYVRASCG